MHNDTVILESLSIGYRHKGHVRLVCSGLGASLRSGQLTCLLGCNGVGKSTLLKTLSAFIPPLDGEIILAGRPLSGYSPKELSRLLGVVLTERVAVDNMTVMELIGTGRSPYTGFWGRLTPEDHAAVHEAVRMVGIESLQDRMVQTLSDGERQKVMIAKALAQHTPVILLDEPTAFLDYPSKVEIMQLLHTLTRDTGKSVFLSTHDVDLALQVADCVWLMKRDGPLRTGSPEDLAIEGVLEDFFPDRNVTFDKAEGAFRIKYRFTGSIAVSGKGQRLQMVSKALRRNEIEPIIISPGKIPSSGMSGQWIEAGESSFRLHLTDGKVYETDSVSGLLSALGL